MNRQSFNPWMIELTAEQFPCALAALSVLDGSGWGLGEPTESGISQQLRSIAERSRGQLDCHVRGSTSRYRTDPPALARILAGAWNKFSSTWSPIRLAVRHYDHDLHPLWLANQLSHPVVGASSVYFDRVMLSPNERWHWPLRLGLLTDDESQKLRTQILREVRIHSWAQDLLTVTPVGGKDQRCDVLLLPHEPRQALSRLLELAPGLTTSCLILTKGFSELERSLHLFYTLERELRTNAGAILALERQEFAPWFINHLLRGISHDLPFDIALWQSLKRTEDLRFPAYLTANSQWLENVRLSQMVGTLMDSVSHPTVADEVVEIKPDLAGRLGLPKGAKLMRDLAGVQISSYLGESHGATTFVHLAKAVAPKLRSNPPAPPARRLQAQVFAEHSTDARTAEPLRAFRLGVLHRIAVRIGEAERDWIVSRKIFPEEGLPPSESGHRLTVVFSEPLLAPQPQIGHIFLPRFGSSSTCFFFLAAAEKARGIEARIAVLYKNRVLQTAILAGPMLSEGQEVTERQSISFVPEVVTSPGMADLDRQSSYGAALIINHTSAGTPQLLKIVDDNAELISTGDLMPSIQQIDDELGRCDWGTKDFRSIQAQGTLKLLRFLAVHGALLYRGVVKQQFLDQSLAKAKSIQLIAAKPGARLPVEYFYDRLPPDENAKLCPTALKSLANGECAQSCTTRLNSSKYICPLGFWGLTRVLEWHAYRPQTARELQSHDYALQQEKLGMRHQLPKVDRALIAASDRANAEVKTSVSSLVKAIKQSAVKVTQSQTWDDWKKQVAAQKPALLIVIPHLDIDKTFNVAKLEIGTGKWLRVDQVDERVIHAPGSQPIVLLLGCETGNQSIPFEDFVSAFAAGGAAVVVSTATLILGRQATLLAQQFISDLHKARKRKDATFGDVMLAVRRNMLRKGYPMVLSVSSYGDADWKL